MRHVHANVTDRSRSQEMLLKMELMLKLEPWKESHNLAAKMSSILNATTASLAAAATNVTTMGGSDNNKRSNNNDDAAAADDAGKYARTRSQTHRHADRALQTVSQKFTHTQTKTANGCRVAAQIAQNVSVKEMARNRATHKTRHVAAESVRE